MLLLGPGNEDNRQTQKQKTIIIIIIVIKNKTQTVNSLLLKWAKHINRVEL